MKVLINLIGCDATTEIDLEVDEKQLKLLKAISEKSKTISTYSCMPIMDVLINNTANEKYLEI